MTGDRNAPVIVLASAEDDVAAWRKHLAQALPECSVVTSGYDDIDPADVSFALTWNAPPGFYAPFRNLKAVLSFGAGVDHILGRSDLPTALPAIPLRDPTLADMVAEYAIAASLAHVRRLNDYAAAQKRHEWTPLPSGTAKDFSVGVLGLGFIGQHVAERLAAIGFSVRGWSRTSRSIPGAQTYAGANELSRVLDGLNVLVCLLPLEETTTGILDRQVFDLLAPGSCLVQLGRGPQLVIDDLLAGLERGRPSFAYLDVLPEEPLPATSSLWDRSDILITPHIAGQSKAATGATVIANDVRQILSGTVPAHARFT